MQFCTESDDAPDFSFVHPRDVFGRNVSWESLDDAAEQRI